MMARRLFLAEVHGMCGGVRRALAILDRIPRHSGETLYVHHEIVHNNCIVERLKRRGVVFVDSPDEVPPGARLVFSAHGVSRTVEAACRARSLRVIDATCPLVKKIHRAAAAGVAAGDLVLLLGHGGHPETEGILGQAEAGAIHLIESERDLASLPAASGRPVRLLSQTTLDTERVERLRRALRACFPELIDDGGICYATRDRQSAVRQLAQRVEAFLVIGSPRSSNSNRLREVAAAFVPARLIDSPAELRGEDFAGIKTLGLSAGASVPEDLIDQVVETLVSFGFGLEDTAKMRMPS